MQTCWNILKQTPEYFILLAILWRSPFLPLFFALLLFGAIYLPYTYHRLKQRHISPLLSIIVYLYYGALFFLFFSIVKINISLNPVPFSLFMCLLAFLVYRRKLSIKISFIVFMYATTLLAFSRGSEDYASKSYKKSFHAEKYIKLLITSDPSLQSPLQLSRVVKTKTLSVRNIFIDKDENFLYFSKLPAGKGRNYKTLHPSLFKVSLKNLTDFQSLYYYSCNNFLYDMKRKLFYLPVIMQSEILVVSPNDFKTKKHIRLPKPASATELFLDRKQDRLIGIPEGGRMWVYRLKDNRYMKIKRGVNFHSGGFLNNADSILYTTSYFGLFFFKEFDTKTFQCTRKIRKFFESSWSFSYHPARKLFYVAGFSSGNIYIISEHTFQITGVLPVKPGIRPIVVDTQRNVLYVGNHLEEYLYVLNMDGKTLGKFFIGRKCRSIILSPKTHRLFAGTSAGISEIYIDAFLKDLRKTH